MLKIKIKKEEKMKKHLIMRLISILVMPTVVTYALVKGTPDSMMEYITIFTVIVFILTGLLMYNLSDIEKFIKYNRQSIGWLTVLRGLISVYTVVAVLYLAIYTDGMIMPLLYSVIVYGIELIMVLLCLALYIKRLQKKLSMNKAC